jgi:prophage DNA circulation protein
MAFPTQLPSIASSFSQLQLASWRGVPFEATVASIGGSVRNAIHEYYGADLPYVEDTGFGPQIFTLTGFIIPGDDCYLQRNALGAAFLTHGPGTLIHPSIGEIQANLQSWSLNDTADGGNVIEVNCSFIKSTSLAFSNTGITAIVTSIDQILTAVNSAIASVKIAVAQTLSVAELVVDDTVSVLTSVTNFAGQIVNFVENPTQIFNSINGLSSLLSQSAPTAGYEISRYNAGNVDGSQNPILAAINTNQAPSQILQQATDAMLLQTILTRAALVQSQTALVAIAGSNPSDPPYNTMLTAVQQFTEQFRQAINDPLDQINALTSAFNITGQMYLGTSTIAATNQSISDCLTAYYQYVVLISIGMAVSEFQPTSQNQTNELVQTLGPLFDSAIDTAGNAEDDNTFNALLDLKSAVITDLQQRGLVLPELITITTQTNLPACVIAWNQYGDANREADILARVNPPDPDRMPLTFQILSN